VLYPAITYAHKNHETLVAAFARLSAAHPEARLVLTGGEGSYEPIVRAAIHAYGLAGTVERTGRIPEADLDVLYRRATAMAFPSRYEGFGLPVLEAMARGCPVVASDVGGLPAVAGDAGVLVDPLDAAAWAEALTDLLERPERRTVLSRRGVERARRFRWPDAAAALASVYRASSPHPSQPIGAPTPTSSEETG
jgi:glycosyltransferase involved in cell wall biosynthesis